MKPRKPTPAGPAAELEFLEIVAGLLSPGGLAWWPSSVTDLPPPPWRDAVATLLHIRRLARGPGQVDQPGTEPILIVGETGTGKELVSQLVHLAIHYPDHQSRSKSARLHRAINCSAIPETLLDAEILGADKGSHSAARELKVGLLEAVGDGVLFLDEIGDTSQSVQVKLLRVIGSRRFTRIGGRHVLDFRGTLVAATNRDLGEAVVSGKLREDLVYRLGGSLIRMPLLRDRPAELARTASYLRRKILGLLPRADLDLPSMSREQLLETARATRTGGRELGFTPDALRWLAVQAWPGNLRELKWVLLRGLETGGEEPLDRPALEHALRRANRDYHPDRARVLQEIADLRRMTDEVMRKNAFERFFQRRNGSSSVTAEEMNEALADTFGVINLPEHLDDDPDTQSYRSRFAASWTRSPSSPPQSEPLPGAPPRSGLLDRTEKELLAEYWQYHLGRPDRGDRKQVAERTGLSASEVSRRLKMMRLREPGLPAFRNGRPGGGG